MKLTFFPDSHLAPKFFKVVANSKKVGRHFQRQTKSFFTLSALVANLATNFQDLVTKVKNLVALAPVLGAISRPGWILNFAYIISISSKRIMSVQLMYECFFFASSHLSSYLRCRIYA